MAYYKLLKTALVAGAAAFSIGYAHAEEFVASLSGFNEIGALASPTGCSGRWHRRPNPYSGPSRAC